jgi:hypothetical protein
MISLSALAAPLKVMIIRHGEKPDSGNELNARGQERALALVNFFTTNPPVLSDGKPVAAIYAMKPSREDGSLRPIQTVTPLAEKLGLTINADIKKDHVDDLIDAVLKNSTADGKTVLICWEHKIIPTIVQRFGWDKAPDKWAGEVFDRVWVLGFTKDKVTSFDDLPQQLLAGDSDKVD